MVSIESLPILSKTTFVLTAIILFSKYVNAQTTTLYIPDTDPQPISASILGVGSDGRTTWLLQQGTPTDDQPLEGFFPTATLVQGPSDVGFAFSTAVPVEAGTEIMSATITCSLASSQAVCTSTIQTILGDQTSVATGVDTEDASPITVQFDGNVPSAATTTDTNSAATSTQANPAPSGPTTSGAPNPTNNATSTGGNNNGAISGSLAGSVLMFSVITSFISNLI